MGKKNPHDEDMRALKDANKKLRQRYRRLQKENRILRDLLNMGHIEEVVSQAEVERIEKKRKCPRQGCGGELSHVTAGIYKIHKCSACTYRKRTEA